MEAGLGAFMPRQGIRAWHWCLLDLGLQCMGGSNASAWALRYGYCWGDLLVLLGHQLV